MLEEATPPSLHAVTLLAVATLPFGCMPDGAGGEWELLSLSDEIVTLHYSLISILSCNVY